jgi:hypothetical protein
LLLRLENWAPTVFVKRVLPLADSGVALFCIKSSGSSPNLSRELRVLQKYEFPMFPPQPIGNTVTNLDAMGLQLLQVRYCAFSHLEGLHTRLASVGNTRAVDRFLGSGAG